MRDDPSWERLRLIRERREEKARREWAAASKRRQAIQIGLDRLDARCRSCRQAQDQLSRDLLTYAEGHAIGPREIGQLDQTRDEYDQEVARLLEQRDKGLVFLEKADAEIAEWAQRYRDCRRATQAAEDIAVRTRSRAGYRRRSIEEEATDE